ncbi:MAG: hypothetical protein K1W26_11890 [Acetatifactor sp.]
MKTLVDRDIWVWTVEGEVIGRSDELSREEIDDLIYNENSEWEIAGTGVERCIITALRRISVFMGSHRPYNGYWNEKGR